MAQQDLTSKCCISSQVSNMGPRLKDYNFLSKADHLKLEETTASFDLYLIQRHNTGISSHIRTKLRDWAIWQARAGCYSQAALSSNDSKTLYIISPALDNIA